MKKWKSIILLVVAVSLAVGLFSVTGFSKSKQVEITWWNYPSWDMLDGEVGKYEKEIIKAFNQKNPNIKVNLEMLNFNDGPQKVNVAIASKSTPDVIYDYPGRILDYGKQGILAKLNDMVDKKFKADVPDAIWKQSMVGNDVYMYPVNTTPFLMAVNKTMFEKAGALDLLPLNRPDRNWTPEEYTKALRAIKEKVPGVYPAAFYCKNTGGDQGTRAYLANLYGSRFINDDMTKVMINDEAGAKALQWVVDAIKEGLIAPGAESMTSNDNLDLFMQGKAATTIIYSSVLKKIYQDKKLVKFEEAFVLFPAPEGFKPKLEPYVGGICVFNNGDKTKIAAAKKLVDFIVNDPEWQSKNLRATGGFSVRNSVKGLYTDPEMSYVESAKKYIADTVTRADGFIEMRTVWFPELQRAIMGKATPKEALDSFAEKANAIFAKNIKK
jgi:multiple sugar transport system substrate-binding protein